MMTTENILLVFGSVTLTIAGLLKIFKKPSAPQQSASPAPPQVAAGVLTPPPAAAGAFAAAPIMHDNSLEASEGHECSTTEPCCKDTVEKIKNA